MARISKEERERQILHNMKALDLTREEAEQLFEDDQNDFIGEEGEQMTINAKEVRRYEKSDTPRKTQKERVKKEHPEKRRIMSELYKVLIGIADCASFTNEERQIAFSIGENDYEITLTQKRKKK